MKPFMNDDFLLTNEVSRALFDACRNEPIFDWHCHLSPKEIYENKTPKNITELWLGGDHYKWRAMRSCGISERYITGDATDYEKFSAFAKTLQLCLGNPLYHWAHLELQRYFDIYEPLNELSCADIWERCNAKIKEGGFTPRELITRSNVVCVCTTDDAADSLEYHALLAKSDFKCRVLPAFRPDKALAIELSGFGDWLKRLEAVCETKIESFEELKTALLSRIEFFAQMGCRASDHGITRMEFCRADAGELDIILQKGKKGEEISGLEAAKYRTELLRFLAKQYCRLGWGMEIHIGPLRNNNTKMFNAIGPDTGFDSIADYEMAAPLSRFLDSLAVEDSLPRTVLFTLNPKDNYVLGTMTGNFQTDEAAGKLQFGTAWWFNDNLDGMREQIKAFANLSVIGKFIGMLTDSRSFLSYPRHEYFRRIFCEFIGSYVNEGLYPDSRELLVDLVKAVAFKNAAEYFGL